MRKIKAAFLLLFVLLLVGCNKTPTDKARAYMKEHYPDLSVSFLDTSDAGYKTIISASAGGTNFTVWVSGDAVTDDYIFTRKMKEASKIIADSLDYEKVVKITAYSETSFQETHGLSGLTYDTDISLADYLKLIKASEDGRLVAVIDFTAFTNENFEAIQEEIGSLVLTGDVWEQLSDVDFTVTVLVNSNLVCSVQVEGGKLVEGTLVNYLEDATATESDAEHNHESDINPNETTSNETTETK